jgi:hypothetical protein
MNFLLIAHAYVRMSAQKVMQRRRAGFLRAGKYEVEPLNSATLGPKHQQNVHREARRGSRQLLPQPGMEPSAWL